MAEAEGVAWAREARRERKWKKMVSMGKPEHKTKAEGQSGLDRYHGDEKQKREVNRAYHKQQR